MSSRLRHAFRSCLLGVLLLTGLGDRASAQSAPGLVVIISVDPASPTSQGVAKDLRGLGLDVLVLKATAENSSGRASLERSARSVGAIAALRLVQAGEGLEVWVADRVTGKTVIRQLVAPPGSAASPEDVALGAVELLRASLMELHAPTPSRGEVELTPAIRQMAYTPTASAPPPPPRRIAPLFAMSAGPAVELGVGALGPSLHGTVAAWLHLWGALGARGFVSLPLLSERETVAEGSVRVGTEVLGAGLSCERQTLGGMVAPEISAGFAAARVGTWGKANAPFVSSFEQGWYAGGYVQIGAALRLVPGMRLRLDGTGVLLATAPEIRIAEHALGTWGAPAVLASLGIEILWSP